MIDVGIKEKTFSRVSPRSVASHPLPRVCKEALLFTKASVTPSSVVRGTNTITTLSCNGNFSLSKIAIGVSKVTFILNTILYNILTQILYNFKLIELKFLQIELVVELNHLLITLEV